MWCCHEPAVVAGSTAVAVVAQIRLSPHRLFSTRSYAVALTLDELRALLTTQFQVNHGELKNLQLFGEFLVTPWKNRFCGAEGRCRCNTHQPATTEATPTTLICMNTTAIARTIASADPPSSLNPQPLQPLSLHAEG